MDDRRRETAMEVEPGLYGTKLVDGAQGARRISLVRGWMHPRGRHSPHTHDVEEAVIFLSGRGVLEIGGETLRVGPGDLVHIPPNTVHSTLNDGDENLCFVAAFADSLIGSNPLATAETATPPKPARRLRHAAAVALLRLADFIAPRASGVTTLP
jgi:quercetin dioxygenase-like cupin family protein